MQITEEQLRQAMSQQNMAITISQLPRCPYNTWTFPQIVSAIERGEIIHAVTFDHTARHTVLSRNEYIVSNVIGNLMSLTPVVLVVAAIWTKHWALLLGIATNFAGQAVSGPWSQGLRRALSSLAVIGLVASPFTNWQIGVLSVCYFIGLGLAQFARAYVNEIVKREVLNSEELFCYEYQRGVLLLKDAKTGRINMGKSILDSTP